MTIALNRYVPADTSYVNKFNSDNATLEAAINALQAALGAGGTGGGGGAGGTGFLELWDRSGLVGASALAVTRVSNTHLSFTSGAAWNLATQTLARTTATQQVAFTGLTAGVYYLNLDAAGGMTASTVPGATAPYSVYYSAPSFASVTRLYPFLFQGDDYARLLSGAVFGSQTRVADRLSLIEAAVTLDALYAQSGVSGTQWSYKAGQVRLNNAIYSAGASYVSLTATQTVYVEVDPTTGTISLGTGGFTSGLIPLRYLKTSGGVLVSNEDRRTWAVAAGSGAGGGGSTSGTAQTLWDLHLGYASAPVSDAGLRVVRGTSATVEVRWNETADQWEFTNDGTSYVALGGLQGLNLGAGRQTRLNVVASMPIVLFEPSRGPSSVAEVSSLLLSTWVSTTTTAVWLRGYMTDSFPGSSLSAGSVAGITFYRSSAASALVVNAEGAKVMAIADSALRYETILVPVSNQACAYQVEAASDYSASVRFALVAYVDTVVGVGTQLVSGTRAGIGLSAGVGSYMVLSATNFAAASRRTLVHYLETSGSMGAGSLYDVEFYGSRSGAQSQLTSALLFQATQIDAAAAYVTRLPWMHVDAESLAQLYLRLSNHGTTSGSFSVVLHGEQYA